jgi:ankyrin repeat protein
VLALLLLLWLTVGVGATVRDAAATGDVDQLRRALASGAGRAAINRTDRYGYGPLQLAAKGGHRKALILLLDHGGDVNLRRDSSCNTPLIMAAAYGHEDCCRLLLDRGAKANATGYFGGTQHTALQCAAQGGYLDVVKFFLERGIGPNEKEGSESALHRACREDHPDVVMTLAAAGADLTSMQEWYWNTPLQLAVKHERHEIAAFLRQATAPHEQRQREIDRKQFEAIQASLQKDNQLIIEAFLHQSTRFVADSNGLHWETLSQGRKPGTYPGRDWDEPTYINGIPWYPRWSTGLYETVLDRSEPCPIQIPSRKNLQFELLGVGESRDRYALKECPNIRIFRENNGTVTIWFSGFEIQFRWCRFRLWWSELTAAGHSRPAAACSAGRACRWRPPGVSTPDRSLVPEPPCARRPSRTCSDQAW